MTTKLIVKLIATATFALASVTVGQSIAQADGIDLTTPAAAGKPYDQNSGSSGLDFTSWTLKDNYVVNNHPTLTRRWSVPITGVSSMQLSTTVGGGVTLVDTGINDYNPIAYCDAAGKARLRIYDASGNALFLGNQVNCSATGVSLGAVPLFTMAGTQNSANVEFNLPPNNAAYSVFVAFVGQLFENVTNDQTTLCMGTRGRIGGIPRHGRGISCDHAAREPPGLCAGRVAGVVGESLAARAARRAFFAQREHR